MNDAILGLCCFSIVVFEIFYVFIFRERGKGGRKRGRETSISCLPHAPNWGPGYNLGMCPDQESNQQRLVHISTLNPLNHAGQGRPMVLTLCSTSSLD